MNLSEVQALFFSLMTQPEQLGTADVDHWFTRSKTLLAEERVKIYTDMYLWRLVDALRSDFPKLVKLLGDEQFFVISSQYVRAHSSEHPDLGKLGGQLAGYLASTGESEELTLPRRERRKILSELAALEWARSEVLLEADAAVCDAGAMAQLRSEQFPAARLQFIPAFRLLNFEYDVASMWKALNDEKEPKEPAHSPNCVAIWRQGFEVFHSMLESDEARAAQRAWAGASLAEVCESFMHQADPTGAAFNAIGSWFVEGWVAKISA